jgi:hypothetical protein
MSTINFTVWNNKRNKIKLNDFVACKYIPTGIGYVIKIVPNNGNNLGTEYHISTLFKSDNDNVAKLHTHSNLYKKDLEILNYNEVPKHISETYINYILESHKTDNTKNATLLTVDKVKKLIKDTHECFKFGNEVVYYNTYKDENSFILAEYYITVLGLLESNLNKDYYKNQLTKDLTPLQKETINFILTSKVNEEIILKNFKPTKTYINKKEKPKKGTLLK